MEAEKVEFESAGKFLLELKKKFKGEDKESVKVFELKKAEQEGKIIEEFVQVFKRAVRESGYKESVLVEEFKRGMNKVIRGRKASN